MMINNAIVYTEEILFQRSSRTILSDISLQIPEGLTIFTGDNGAGKSTLLKILGNIYTPSSGTLYYCNNKYKRYSSFMFQEPIFLNRTVNDNIKHALKCHKASKMNYQYLIKEYLDKFSIGHLIDSYPRNLSTGEKRIISFMKRQKIDKAKLINYLKTKLEGYKIPYKIIKIDKFPLNKNGKIDTMKLVQYI